MNTILDNHLGQQEFEESSEQEACSGEEEDGASGDQETLTDGSISATEEYETQQDWQRQDVENTGNDDSFSSQERENSVILDKNEKLLEELSQKKKQAFDKLPKRKEADDSSESQEGELM